MTKSDAAKLQLIQFDRRYINAAVAAILGAFINRDFRDVFEGQINDDFHHIEIGSVKVSFLIMMMIKEIADHEPEYVDAIMKTLQEFHRNPAAAVGFDIMPTTHD